MVFSRGARSSVGRCWKLALIIGVAAMAAAVSGSPSQSAMTDSIEAQENGVAAGNILVPYRVKVIIDFTQTVLA